MAFWIGHFEKVVRSIQIEKIDAKLQEWLQTFFASCVVDKDYTVFLFLVLKAALVEVSTPQQYSA